MALNGLNASFRFEIPKTAQMNFAFVPKIRRLMLELKHKAGCDDRRFIVVEMALLRLLTGRTPRPIFARRPIPELEVRRGQCMGTRIILDRQDEIRAFLTKACLFAMGRDEDFSGLAKSIVFAPKRLAFKLKGLLLFPDTEPFFDIFETIPFISVKARTTAQHGYHVACDPQRLPLSDYYWLQREGIRLKKLDALMKKRTSPIKCSVKS